MVFTIRDYFGVQEKISYQLWTNNNMNATTRRLFCDLYYTSQPINVICSGSCDDSHTVTAIDQNCSLPYIPLTIKSSKQYRFVPIDIVTVLNSDLLAMTMPKLFKLNSWSIRPQEQLTNLGQCAVIVILTVVYDRKLELNAILKAKKHIFLSTVKERLNAMYLISNRSSKLPA